MSMKKLAAALLLVACLPGAAFAGPTLDRIRDSGHIRFAYLPNARPFTTAASGGAAEGYSAELCKRIAEQVKAQLGLQQLTVDWVEVRADNVLQTMTSGGADVLCTPSNSTLERRRSLSYSLPIFAGGVRAVVRNDAPSALRDALEAQPSQRNVWRGSPSLSMIEQTRFGVVAGTSAEKVLASKVKGFKLNTVTVSVPDYASGIKFLLERKIDVFLAERDVALAAMDDAAHARLVVLNRQLTHEPLALAIPRGDDDFRLQVDSALSAAYNSPEFSALYVKYFHKMDDATRTFFAWVTPPL
jgi:polar amino acid transport system substrate-binding protein